MYHCHIHFFFFGSNAKLFEPLKTIPPLEHFTHEFAESSTPDKALLLAADVIFADLGGQNAADTVQTLLSGMKPNAQLIVFADNGQMTELTGRPDGIRDIWTLPLSDGEIKFRFLRWQQAYKTETDYWQTSQYLETTINSIPTLVWYKTKDGIHTKVNDSFCRTVEKTKAQVEGRGHAYIWDVEHDDPACIESELEVMQKQKTCISEETVRTREGSRLLTTYKSPLYDLDGSVMGTVGVAIDITQEQQYKQRLLNKTKILETLFTTMECGILCHTTDGSCIISVNKAALKILGYESQEELMHDGFAMIAPSVHDEDKPTLRRHIMSLQNVGNSVNVSYRVQHDDGKILHVIGNIKLMEENGELFYQRFLLDCTTQRVREEEEQKEKEKRQVELIQALSIDYNLVCFFDLDTGTGHALRINDCKYGVLDSIFNGELSLTENLNQYIDRCVHSEDRELLRSAVTPDSLMQKLSRSPITYVNYRTTCCDKVRYFQMKAVCTGNWTQNHEVVLGFRSVDEETRIEMEKKNMLEDALLQANRANHAKSAFLSNMSHDIRTPMNAIIGFTSLAISHIDRKEQVDEYLRKIMASGSHLLNLINNVLDMSHIESGKMHLSEQLCSLPDIMQDLHSIVQADTQAKQIDLQMDNIDILNEDIYCDKLRLNQVLLNLLNNSIKYTPAGGRVTMTLTEKAGAPEGYSHYEFQVSDNGIGMSEEFVAHIFEPFERERNSTISGIQGTGLGMAITKNIVDMMRGSIEVTSKQNVGTEFTVSFTFRIGAKPKEGPKQTDKGEQAASRLRAVHILLVEDNELNQEIAAELLGEAGFTTELAGNGQMAIDMLTAAGPGYYQLVLMDIQMPVMNGYDAARAIRKLDNPELASIPVLAMTANAFEEDKREALQSGMNGHIAKPINIDELLKTLNELLNKHE